MESRTQIEDRAAEWLAKRDSGEWNDADRAHLTEWLDASTAHRVAFLRLEAAWEEALRLKALTAGLPHGTVPPPGQWRHTPFFERQRPETERDIPAELRPEALRDSTFIPSRVRRTGRIKTLAAASGCLALGIGTYFAFVPSGDRYTTPIGGVASVPLSDGSNITLNTASQVRVELTPTERHVRLDKGEAFFEVAKDPNRPFIVQVDGKRVVAVGTRFSVRRNGNDIRVAVTEGKVRVEDNGETLLTPGSVASTDNDRVTVQEESIAAVEDHLSWRQGYLTFHDTSLADAVAEFNRYNTHRITIEDPKIAAIRISGTFRAINYQAFVRVLDDGFAIHAKSTNDTTTLTAD